MVPPKRNGDSLNLSNLTPTDKKVRTRNDKIIESYNESLNAEIVILKDDLIKKESQIETLSEKLSIMNDEFLKFQAEGNNVKNHMLRLQDRLIKEQDIAQKVKRKAKNRLLDVKKKADDDRVNADRRFTKYAPLIKAKNEQVKFLNELQAWPGLRILPTHENTELSRFAKDPKPFSFISAYEYYTSNLTISNITKLSVSCPRSNIFERIINKEYKVKKEPIKEEPDLIKFPDFTIKFPNKIQQTEIENSLIKVYEQLKTLDKLYSSEMVKDECGFIWPFYYKEIEKLNWEVMGKKERHDFFNTVEYQRILRIVRLYLKAEYGNIRTFDPFDEAKAKPDILCYRPFGGEILLLGGITENSLGPLFSESFWISPRNVHYVEGKELCGGLDTKKIFSRMMKYARKYEANSFIITDGMHYGLFTIIPTTGEPDSDIINISMNYYITDSSKNLYSFSPAALFLHMMISNIESENDRLYETLPLPTLKENNQCVPDENTVNWESANVTSMDDNVHLIGYLDEDYKFTRIQVEGWSKIWSMEANYFCSSFQCQLQSVHINRKVVLKIWDFDTVERRLSIEGNYTQGDKIRSKRVYDHQNLFFQNHVKSMDIISSYNKNNPENTIRTSRLLMSGTTDLSSRGDRKDIEGPFLLSTFVENYPENINDFTEIDGIRQMKILANELKLCLDRLAYTQYRIGKSGEVTFIDFQLCEKQSEEEIPGLNDFMIETFKYSLDRLKESLIDDY